MSGDGTALLMTATRLPDAEHRYAAIANELWIVLNQHRCHTVRVPLIVPHELELLLELPKLHRELHGVSWTAMLDNWMPNWIRTMVDMPFSDLKRGGRTSLAFWDERTDLGTSLVPWLLAGIDVMIVVQERDDDQHLSVVMQAHDAGVPVVRVDPLTYEKFRVSYNEAPEPQGKRKR